MTESEKTTRIFAWKLARHPSWSSPLTYVSSVRHRWTRSYWKVFFYQSWDNTPIIHLSMSFITAILRLVNAYVGWRDARNWMCTFSFYGYTSNFHIPSLFTIFKDCWNCYIYPLHGVSQHLCSRFLNSYLGIKCPASKNTIVPFTGSFFICGCHTAHVLIYQCNLLGSPGNLSIKAGCLFFLICNGHLHNGPFQIHWYINSTSLCFFKIIIQSSFFFFFFNWKQKV